MKIRSRPISLQVTIAPGEDPLSPLEVQGYSQLAEGPSSFRFAADNLEPLAGVAPILGLRMADVCGQQGALGLALKLNNVFVRRSRCDPTLGSPEERFRGDLNSALFAGGASTTLRNAVSQGVIGELANPQNTRERFDWALPLLEAALSDKPDNVLDYVLLFARARLLSPAAASETLRCIEQHADELNPGRRAEAKTLLAQLCQQDQMPPAESSAGDGQEVSVGIRRRRWFSRES